MVAGAFIPPKHIRLHESDLMASSEGTDKIYSADNMEK